VKPFRVGIILEQHLEVGGGFQQPLNDLLWFREWAAANATEVVVFTPHRQNVAALSDFGIEVKQLATGFLDRVALLMKYLGPFDLLQFSLRMRAPYERKLLKHGIDLVYFTTTSNWHLLLYQLPFVITIFDGCHRDSPEFGEVREFGEFERREMLFRSASTKAALVVTNADELVETLARRYAIQPDRAICIPFSPSAYITQSSAENDRADSAVLRRHGLDPGYLFYPAQFWSHKNHATLLRALVLLRAQGLEKRLVLCGSDRGMRDNIEKMILRLQLGKQVKLLGFVPSTDLGALYRGAHALVMPTYFGPTNLPPLEAWTTGTPVVYPEAFKAQVADAALLFDYDRPDSLAEAILKLEDAELRQRLKVSGAKRLEYFNAKVQAGRQQFALQLERLKYRILQTRDLE